MALPAPDGRITLGSNKAHLESVHPDVIVPTRIVATGTPDNPDVPIDTNSEVTFADSANLDAFARLRVSNPTGLFDSQLQYDLHRILWEDTGTGTVTHNAFASLANLIVDPGESIMRQTRQYFRYQPGKSQLVMMTFRMPDSVSGLTQRVGYFDDFNGIFFEVDDTTNYVVIRSYSAGSVIENRIPQSSWNFNTLAALDTAATQILFLDMEWLGVGRVRIGFVIDGLPVYVHEFNHANNEVLPYMGTANLPLRYEIDSDVSTVGTQALVAICGQVSAEGGVEFSRGIPFSASNGATLKVVTPSSYEPLVSIRPKSTFNSITNRGMILPENASVFSTDRDIHYRLIFGGALTGATYSSVNADSIVEYDVAATDISGGIDITSDYVATGSGNNTGGNALRDFVSLLPLFLDIAGSHPTTPYTDVLTIAAISAEAQNANCGATLSWRELR